MKASLLAAALLLAMPMAATGIAAHAKPVAPHYDCTKVGNKSKAACKTPAAAGTSSSTVASSKLATALPPKAKSFDCTKAGNKNKAQCKTTTTLAAATPQMPPVTPKPLATGKPPMPTPAATVAKTAATTATNSPAGRPAGATAQCKDGSYSMSKHHSGSCSHHGGVKQFFS